MAGYAEREYNKTQFLKSVQLAILESRDLQACFKSDAGKMSLFHALRYASATGLSLNPQEGKAALIGYKDKNNNMVINYQVMKNGLLDLAMDSGKVESIMSDVVKEGDEFRLTKTSAGDDFSFSPALKDRVEIVGFFASLKMKDGTTHVSWMTLAEVEDHRDKYARGLYYKDGNPVKEHAWHKSFEGMGLKTVIKRLFRNISISSDVDRAIGVDDQFEADTINITPQGGESAEDVTKKLKDKKAEAPVVEKAETVGDDNQGSLL